MRRLNPAETEALVRNLDGVTELEGFAGVRLNRRDSFDHECHDGVLTVRVEFTDGSFYEDVISETGSTTGWYRTRLRYWDHAHPTRAYQEKYAAMNG